jgi:hypothetical protein
MGISDIDPGTNSNAIPSAFDHFPMPEGSPPLNQTGENKLVCGFVLGTSTTTGTTGCGLYAILRAAYDNLVNTAAIASGDSNNNLFFNNLDCFALPPGELQTKNPIFIISDLFTLRSSMNELHNNINYLIFRVDYNRTDPSGNATFPFQGQFLAATNPNSVRQYNFYTNYLFYGSYTGAENVNPGQPFVGTDLPLGDLMGNGITAAFSFANPKGDGVFNPGDGFISRAGLELFALYNYLKYGGIAVIASSYEDLYKIKDKEILSPDYLDPEQVGTRYSIVPNGLDCILTLDNTSMLTGVNNTNNSNDDGMVYGGAYYGANTTDGLTIYNLTQGLLPEYLGNSFCGNGFRGNIFSSILEQEKNPDTLMIFHAGLSGVSFAYSQDFLDQPELGFRHPSTDGIQFLYRQRVTNSNFNSNPGLTLGTLNTNQLQRLCCVPGVNNYRFYWTVDGVQNGTVVGGGPDGTLWVPCLHVVEFVGLLNWVKDVPFSGQIFESNIGQEYRVPIVGFLPLPPNQKVSSTQYSVSGTEYNTLIPKRLNVLSQQGYFPTDLVGATGSSFVIRNRRNAETLYSFAYKKALEVVNLFIGSNFINNTETRNRVIEDIQIEYETVSLNRYLRNPYTIICNTSNNTPGSSKLTVEVTITPKITQFPGGGIPLRFKLTGG